MNLGSLFGGFGRKIDGAAKTGWNKLGELRDKMQDGQPSPTFRQPQRMPITGGFAGNEGVPTFDLGRMGKMRGETGGVVEAQPMGGAQRPQSLERLASPEQTMPQPPQLPFGGAGHPPLTGFDPEGTAPPLPVLRDSVNITDTIPQGGVSVSPHGSLGPIAQRNVPQPMRSGPQPVLLGAPQSTPMAGSAPRDASFDSRQDVPIPGRPNRGGPVPYSDYEAGKYDAWSRHAKRDEQGNFDPKGGTNRNWKSILQNALLGAANNSEGGDIGRMIGGALGGAGGSAINPQAGYEQVWDAGHGRQMMQGQARRDAEMNRGREQRIGGLKERGMEADIGLKEAQRKRAERIPGNIGEASWGTYDVTTGRPIYERPGAQPRPQAPAWKQTRTGEWFDANDPKNSDLLRQGAPPMNTQDRMLNVSPGGAVFDPRTGHEAYRNPSRGGSRGSNAPSRTGGGDDIPVEARQQHTRVQSLKQKADRLWTAAKTARDEGQRAALEEQARAALEDYNRNAEDFGRAYGDYYETGSGEGGWNFIKPKVSESGGGQSGGGSPKARLSDLKKFLQ